MDLFFQYKEVYSSIDFWRLLNWMIDIWKEQNKKTTAILEIKHYTNGRPAHNIPVKFWIWGYRKRFSCNPVRVEVHVFTIIRENTNTGTRQERGVKYGSFSAKTGDLTGMAHNQSSLAPPLHPGHQLGQTLLWDAIPFFWCWESASVVVLLTLAMSSTPKSVPTEVRTVEVRTAEMPSHPLQFWKWSVVNRY